MTDPGSPGVTGILETALYVDDLERAASFYQSLFGFSELVRDGRLCALGIENRQVLLLFRRGASGKPGETPGGTIPPHDGHGNLHLALAIDASALESWKEKLKEAGIEIESTVRWPRGGTSLYFRDPDDHSVELATPGTWSIF